MKWCFVIDNEKITFHQKTNGNYQVFLYKGEYSTPLDDLEIVDFLEDFFNFGMDV